jgi:hypothetical protein
MSVRATFFTFGIVACCIAGLFTLAAVVQSFASGSDQNSMGGFARERTFYNWSGLVSSFATLGGLCFAAAAIVRHAEKPAVPEKTPKRPTRDDEDD